MTTSSNVIVLDLNKAAEAMGKPFDETTFGHLITAARVIDGAINMLRMGQIHTGYFNDPAVDLSLAIYPFAKSGQLDMICSALPKEFAGPCGPVEQWRLDKLGDHVKRILPYCEHWWEDDMPWIVYGMNSIPLAGQVPFSAKVYKERWVHAVWNPEITEGVKHE